MHRNDVRTLFRTVLNVELVPLDELSCLIRGLNAMLFLRPRQLLFMYQAESENKTRFIEAEGIYPYLLVNCGSGVSVLLVTGPGEFSRVSGSSLGGGTLLGVCRLLTGIESFDTLMQVGQSGNPDNVDLLVQDIYGGDYTQMGLPGNLLASSMGKAHAGCQYNKSDLVAALVRMVGINVAQVGFLNAKVHGVRRVIYTGFLVRDRPEIWERISYGFNFWSKSTLDAVYVSYDGFLGAQGAFVHQFVSNGPSPGASPDADRRARDTHAPAAAAASAAGASVSVASTPSGAAASSHAQASASPAKSSAKRTS